MSTAPTTRPPREEDRGRRLHAALASGTRPPRPSALSTAMTFAWRSMLKIKHVPEQLLDVTVTPILFLLMFTYLFGGAVSGSTSEYLQYILPGILVQSVLFTTVYSGVTLNTDVTKGVVDRFRSLPIWGASPLMGAVLGDAVRYLIAGSTSAYLDYILPGILVMSVLFTTVYSGISLNADLTKGVVDRFRSLPIWRPSPLLGSLLGDSVRYVIAGTVIIVLGVALGFRPEGGLLGTLGALAVVVVFSFGLSWVFSVLGLLLRSPNAVMNAGFTGIFPLTFLSNVFVDPQTLPGPLQAFVDVNPVSTLATASRSLMAGDPDGRAIVVSLLTAAVLAAVFLPLTTRLYRNR